MTGFISFLFVVCYPKRKGLYFSNTPNSVTWDGGYCLSAKLNTLSCYLGHFPVLSSKRHMLWYFDHWLCLHYTIYETRCPAFNFFFFILLSRIKMLMTQIAFICSLKQNHAHAHTLFCARDVTSDKTGYWDSLLLMAAFWQELIFVPSHSFCLARWLLTPAELSYLLHLASEYLAPPHCSTMVNIYIKSKSCQWELHSTWQAVDPRRTNDRG